MSVNEYEQKRRGTAISDYSHECKFKEREPSTVLFSLANEVTRMLSLFGP